MPHTVERAHGPGAGRLITLEGVLTEAEVNQLESEIRALVDEAGVKVYIDLSRASRLAPAVVQSLVRLAVQLRQSGGVLTLVSRKRPTGRVVVRPLDPDRPESMFGIDITLDRALVRAEDHTAA
jgi:anti-anti-sigma regulatory factor